MKPPTSIERPSVAHRDTHDELGTDLIVVIARYPLQSAVVAAVLIVALVVHQLALGPV